MQSDRRASDEGLQGLEVDLSCASHMLAPVRRARLRVHLAPRGRHAGDRLPPRNDPLRSEAEDVRALPEFGEVRHEVWSLLREEVQKAQQLAGGVAARRLEREVKEVAHV